jgi:hypothetical protein
MQLASRNGGRRRRMGNGYNEGYVGSPAGTFKGKSLASTVNGKELVGGESPGPDFMAGVANGGCLFQPVLCGPQPP